MKTLKILFKTQSFLDPNQWTSDFNSLAPETIAALALKNVHLVGIDTPSVDPADDKELLTHNHIYKYDMAILEGIMLDNIEAGDYILLAAPLKIEAAEAAPVRAILMRGGF